MKKAAVAVKRTRTAEQHRIAERKRQQVFKEKRKMMAKKKKEEKKRGHWAGPKEAIETSMTKVTQEEAEAFYLKGVKRQRKSPVEGEIEEVVYTKQAPKEEIQWTDWPEGCVFAKGASISGDGYARMKVTTEGIPFSFCLSTKMYRCYFLQSMDQSKSLAI